MTCNAFIELLLHITEKMIALLTWIHICQLILKINTIQTTTKQWRKKHLDDVQIKVDKIVGDFKEGEEKIILILEEVDKGIWQRK